MKVVLFSIEQGYTESRIVQYIRGTYRKQYFIVQNKDKENAFFFFSIELGHTECSISYYRKVVNRKKAFYSIEHCIQKDVFYSIGWGIQKLVFNNIEQEYTESSILQYRARTYRFQYFIVLNKTYRNYHLIVQKMHDSSISNYITRTYRKQGDLDDAREITAV